MEKAKEWFMGLSTPLRWTVIGSAGLVLTITGVVIAKMRKPRRKGKRKF